MQCWHCVHTSLMPGLMLYSQQQQKIIVQDRDNEVKSRNGRTIINCCLAIHHNKSIHNGTENLRLIYRYEIKVLKFTDFTSVKINWHAINLSTISRNILVMLEKDAIDTACIHYSVLFGKAFLYIIMSIFIFLFCFKNICVL